jgi:hypothetical protein
MQDGLKPNLRYFILMESKTYGLLNQIFGKQGNDI